MSTTLPTCNTTIGNNSYYVSPSNAASNVLSLGFNFIMIWIWGGLLFVFFLISAFLLASDGKFSAIPIIIYIITLFFLYKVISNYLSYRKAKDTLAKIGQPCTKSN